MESEIVVGQVHPFADDYVEDALFHQYNIKTDNVDQPSVQDLYYHGSRFDNNTLSNIENGSTPENAERASATETVQQRMLDDDDDDGAVFSPTARVPGYSKPGFFASNSIANVDIDVGETPIMQSVTSSRHRHIGNITLLSPVINLTAINATGGRANGVVRDAQMSKDRLLCMHYANFRRDINPTTGHLSFMSDCLYCHRTIAGVQKYVWRRSCIRHLENIHKKLVVEPGFRPIGGHPGEARFSEQGDIIFTDNDAAPAASLMPLVVASGGAPVATLLHADTIVIDGESSYNRGYAQESTRSVDDIDVSFVTDEGDIADDNNGISRGVADDQQSPTHYSDDVENGTGETVITKRDEVADFVRINRGTGSVPGYLPIPPPPLGTDLSTAELVLDHYSNLRQEERTKGRVYVADCKYCRKAIVGHEKSTQVGHFREHTRKRHIEMNAGGTQQMHGMTRADVLKSANKTVSMNNLLQEVFATSPSPILDSHQQLVSGVSLSGYHEQGSLLMWRQFFEDPVHEDDTYRAACKLCSKLVYGSRLLTMCCSFSQHLRDQHKLKVSESGAIMEKPNAMSFGVNGENIKNEYGFGSKAYFEEQQFDPVSDALKSTNFAAQLPVVSSGAQTGYAISSAADTHTRQSMTNLPSRVLPKTDISNNNELSLDAHPLSNNIPLTGDPDENSTPSKVDSTNDGSRDRTNGVISKSPVLAGDCFPWHRSESPAVHRANDSADTNNSSGDVRENSDYDGDSASPGKMKKREEDNLIRQRVLEHYIVGQGRTSAGSSCCVGKCRHCNITVTTSRKHIHIPKFTAHLSRHHADVFSTLGITLEHNKTKITKKKKTGSSLRSAHLVVSPASPETSNFSNTTVSTINHSKVNAISNSYSSLSNSLTVQPPLNSTNFDTEDVTAKTSASPVLQSSSNMLYSKSRADSRVNAANSSVSHSTISDFAHKFLTAVQAQQQQQNQQQLINATMRCQNTDSSTSRDAAATLITTNNATSSAFSMASAVPASSSPTPTVSLLGKAAATSYLLNTPMAVVAAAVHPSSDNNSKRQDNFPADFQRQQSMLLLRNDKINTQSKNIHSHGNTSQHSRRSILRNDSSDTAVDQSNNIVGNNREKSLILLRYPFSHPHDPCDKCYLMLPTVAPNEAPTDKIRDLRAILEREGRKLDAVGSTYEIARDGITVLNKLESINFHVASMAVNATEYFWTLRSEV